MDANIARVLNLDRNNMTVRQQVKNLLASVRMKQDLLARQNETITSEVEETEKERSEDDETRDFVSDKSPSKEADFESIEIATNHKDFESLVDEKLREESSRVSASKNECQTGVVKKRPFLKKGEGLARFRMKPRDAPSKRRTDDTRKPVREVAKSNDTRSAPLIAFEQLEQKLDDSSFCSTSSMIAKLMEESIKSTPIKSIEFVQTSSKGDSGPDKSDVGTLGVIDEESSVYDADEDDEETLKSLVEARLLELEAEISVFQSEKAHLSKLRSDYEKEYNQFCQERVALLENIRAEQLSGAKELEEEKVKLQHEKRAFEKHMREVRNRPTREEKEEIRLLKEEMQLLKEEMNKKESRWAAAQARVRTEMKLLKDHNSALQEELNELKETSKKKVMFAPVLKRSKSFSGVDNVSKSNDEHTTTLTCSAQFDSILNLPLSSDSGVFSEDFRSSNESCDSANKGKDDIDKLPSAFWDSVAEICESVDSSGSRTKKFADGRIELWQANGTVRKISPDGKVQKTIFYNGDVEEVDFDANSVKYYHAASQMRYSKIGDGPEIKEFADGQVEKYFKDGLAVVELPDGTVFTRKESGEKMWCLKDGSVVTAKEGQEEKQITFPNGLVEVHNPAFKRLEYPDGTTKTIFNGSGWQETRYPSGRLRLKNQDGVVVVDTMIDPATLI